MLRTIPARVSRQVRRANGVLLAILVSASAGLAQDSPFAAPPAPGSQRALSAGAEDLGSLMTLIQIRHVKLWYAGTAGNWHLVDYQAQRMKDDLARAATLYVNIPVDSIAAAQSPLTAMQAAAKSANLAAFREAYAGLNHACNACHVAGDIPFIRIQTPTSSVLSDETYPPPKP